MWNLNVPKVLHAYWGENELPYLRYLTLYSFLLQNPDWLIKLYVPTHPSTTKSWKSFEQKYEVKVTDNYFEEVLKFVELHKVNFEYYNLSNDISEVIKSDFLRWNILATEGGLWSDMDIVYFKSMDTLSFNTPDNSEVNTFICINEVYGHSIGFLLSSPNNNYFSLANTFAKKHFNPNNYQSVGSMCLQRISKTIEQAKKVYNCNPLNIPMDAVYAYDSFHINDIYFKDDLSSFSQDTIGLHWYAGHPNAKEVLDNLTEKNYFHFGNIGKTVSLAYKVIVRDTVQSIVSPDSTVLNLGCGRQEISNELSCKVTNVDIWEPFKPDIVWDLTNLPLPFLDNSYDVIMMLDVIEHLDREKGFKLLQELKRVTKKYIILLTPLWWTANVAYQTDPNHPYYGNVYNQHRSLWNIEDFPDWKRLYPYGVLQKYFFGLYEKEEVQRVRSKISRDNNGKKPITINRKLRG